MFSFQNCGLWPPVLPRISGIYFWGYRITIFLRTKNCSRLITIRFIPLYLIIVKYVSWPKILHNRFFWRYGKEGPVCPTWIIPWPGYIPLRGTKCWMRWTGKYSGKSISQISEIIFNTVRTRRSTWWSGGSRLNCTRPPCRDFLPGNLKCIV